MHIIFYYLACVLLRCGFAQIHLNSTSCSQNISIDISNSDYDLVKKSFRKDNITYETDNYFKSGESILGCVCNIKICITKCCPPGQVKFEDKCLPYDAAYLIQIYNGTVFSTETDPFLIYTDQKIEKYVLESQVAKYYIQKNGDIWVFESNEKTVYPIFNYCIEYLSIESEKPVLSIFININEVDIDESDDGIGVRYIKQIGMIISIPFLLLTFVVYGLLPDRNVPGQCLMGFVFSLMSAYIFLISIQLANLGDIACITLAGLCLFSFMSSFCWMNVSCVDIFLTFSGRRGFRGSRKSAERKRFALYCLYAWGLPLLLVGVIFGLNSSVDKAAWYHPNFGHGQCWLGQNYPLLLYFYGPMGIMLIVNVVLFSLTAWKIRQTQQSTKQLQKGESKKHYNESDKQRFNLYLKLLFVMGINWSLEFISWLVDWLLGSRKFPQIWYLTDLCNALYGVFIFFIFVFKRNIWVALQKRYFVFIGQPQKANALSSRISHSNQMSKTENTIVDETVLSDIK